MTGHVVMFSGGVGSWGAAKRLVERHGSGDLTLLFTDTLAEDSDLYRFLAEGAAHLFGTALPAPLGDAIAAVPDYHGDRFGRRMALAAIRDALARVLPGLVWIVEGRDPWQVFADERFLGNSAIDPCSRVLKRRPAERWLRRHRDPSDTVLYLGIDWTELHRFAGDRRGGGARARWAAQGWRLEAPLCEAPPVARPDILGWLHDVGIAPPDLTRRGFAHNNCSGFCCKAGQGHYVELLRQFPERYAFHEVQEQALRRDLGRDVAMMASRHGGGPKKPLTLAAFRHLVAAGHRVDRFEIGGCGCFVDGDAVPSWPATAPQNPLSRTLQSKSGVR
ncbi:MAG: hypothetical protein P4M00_24790 [Azospirillaceae bacterium]|nr:hypothetical protein [Azospirillaceae bacterium]